VHGGARPACGHGLRRSRAPPRLLPPAHAPGPRRHAPARRGPRHPDRLPGVQPACRETRPRSRNPGIVLHRSPGLGVAARARPATGPRHRSRRRDSPLRGRVSAQRRRARDLRGASAARAGARGAVPGRLLPRTRSRCHAAVAGAVSRIQASGTRSPPGGVPVRRPPASARTPRTAGGGRTRARSAAPRLRGGRRHRRRRRPEPAPPCARGGGEVRHLHRGGRARGRTLCHRIPDAPAHLRPRTPPGARGPHRHGQPHRRPAGGPRADPARGDTGAARTRAASAPRRHRGTARRGCWSGRGPPRPWLGGGGAAGGRDCGIPVALLPPPPQAVSG